MPYKNVVDRRAQGKRAYAKKLATHGRDKVRALNKESYARRAETLSAERREIRASSSPTEGAMRREYFKWRSRRWRLKGFGLSEADFDLMLANQLWACAICLAPFVEHPQTDHDHRTGTVRGLLCGGCNRSIGLLRDSPENCIRAAAYLTKASTGR